MASRNLEIHCSRCGAHVVSYRKEGSGALLRLYLDRIGEVFDWDVQIKNFAPKNFPPLVCPQCKEHIGFPIQNNSCRAWRLIPGSFRKKG